MSESLEVLGKDPNAWVVQVPGRAYPGLVIQGDSLKNLHSLTGALREHLARSDHDEADEIAGEVRDILASYLAAYEKALREHELELPYRST